jgi:hypothetical protein
VTTVLSLGTSIPAKTSAKVVIKTAAKKLAKDAVKAAVKAAKSALTGKFKKYVLNKAAKKARETLKDMLKGKFQETMITSICGKVWESISKKEITAPTFDDIGSKVLDTIDVLGVGNVYNSCKDTSDGGLGCGKAIVDSLSAFDPSGLLTIASAFMHPTCDVPVSKPKDFEFADIEADTSTQTKAMETPQMRSLKEITESIPKNCLWVFNKPNFGGDKLEICSNLEFVGYKHDNKILSFVAGADTEGYFFADPKWGGQFLKFTKGLAIDDTVDITLGKVYLRESISSVWLGNNDFLILWAATDLYQKIYNRMFVADKQNKFELYFTKSNSNKHISKLGLYHPSGKIIKCSFTDGKNQRKEITYEKTEIIDSSSWPYHLLEWCKLL